MKKERTEEDEQLLNLADKYFTSDELDAMEEGAERRYMRDVLGPKLREFFERKAEERHSKK